MNQTSAATRPARKNNGISSNGCLKTERMSLSKDAGRHAGGGRGDGGAYTGAFKCEGDRGASRGGENCEGKDEGDGNFAYGHHTNADASKIQLVSAFARFSKWFGGAKLTRLFISQ